MTGTNFVTGATVSIGGVACTGVTVVSTTSITATLPATTAGSLAASVTTANGTGSRAGAYVALECAGLSYSLHYAGAGQTLTGSDVTAVADQGPTAKALTGVGTLPTLVASNAGYNNRATWNFADNTSSLDSAAFAISQPVTRFVVGHSSGVGALPHYLADGLSGYLGLSGSGTGGGGSAEMYAGGGYSISVDPTVKRVWTEQFSGATSRFSASSNTETVGTANASSPGGIRLGVTNTGGFGIGAAGALALQLQIYGTLTQGQRDTNRALLGAYYGITIV